MLFLFLLACGDDKKPAHHELDSGTIEDVEVCEVSWDAWANGFFTTYCKSCHLESSTNRYGAPENVNIANIDDVRTWSTRIRIRVLDEETMPVGGGVPEEDLLRLSEWMDCLEDTP